MNTTGLENCEIDIQGTLLGTKISYWLSYSMPVGYQNPSSAWIFGGRNVQFKGYEYGTINGNGQVWYDFIDGASNYLRRPHAITIWNTHNSLFEGIRFLQSQMWNMTVIHSTNVLLEDIYVSSTSNSSASTANTDGPDTIYANNITFNKWTVTNGDDGISPKANSTNILVTNSTFNSGNGIALGSIDQYNGALETIENFTAKDIVCNDTTHTVYLKTWTGQQVGYPPNGGGGGLGYIRNVTLENFTLQNIRSYPISITQCITFSGVAGDCNTSEFEIEDVTFQYVKGTTNENPIASFQCSAAAPCKNIAVEDVQLTLKNGTEAYGWLCNNVEGSMGFNCTGSTCEKPSADGSC